jgi:peptidoglycan hydrolase-like protein with peptidoglycan-binding domain
LYLYKYIRLGADNDPVEVTKLQKFLNQNLGADLPVTGYYGLATYAAVQQFQLKYNESVLAPWVPYGLPAATDATGYVFKTTRREINNIVCPPLNLPLPDLSSSAS